MTWNTKVYLLRNFRYFDRPTCAICGFWLISFISIHPGSRVFNKLHSNTPSLKVYAKSRHEASGQFALWSWRKTSHLVNQFAHSFQDSLPEAMTLKLNPEFTIDITVEKLLSHAVTNHHSHHKKWITLHTSQGLLITPMITVDNWHRLRSDFGVSAMSPNTR